MKLFLQDNVIIRINQCSREEDTERMERYLKRKLKRNVVLLDARYGEILTLPPEKHPVDAPRRP